MAYPLVARHDDMKGLRAGQRPQAQPSSTGTAMVASRVESQLVSMSARGPKLTSPPRCHMSAIGWLADTIAQDVLFSFW